MPDDKELTHELADKLESLKRGYNAYGFDPEDELPPFQEIIDLLEAIVLRLEGKETT